MDTEYTDAQRETAIMLIGEGATIADAAAELNIPRSTVSTWWRGRSPTSDEIAKPAQVSASGTEDAQLRISQLEGKLASLEELLKHHLYTTVDAELWCARKMRAEG